LAVCPGGRALKEKSKKEKRGTVNVHACWAWTTVAKEMEITSVEKFENNGNENMMGKIGGE